MCLSYSVLQSVRDFYHFLLCCFLRHEQPRIQGLSLSTSPSRLTMASSKSGSVDFQYFRYDPSLAAAIIFIAAFMITSTFHVYQMISTRTWYLIPLVIGGCCQCKPIHAKTAKLANTHHSRSCRIHRASCVRRANTKFHSSTVHYRDPVPSRGASFAGRIDIHDPWAYHLAD